MGTGPEAIPEPLANRLIAIARKARVRLRVGGSDGEAILVQRGQTLFTGQVVGVLAAPGITFEILPKIDGQDEGQTRRILIRMLARTVGLKIYDGDLTHLGMQKFDLLEILIRLFCNRLFSAIHRGLPQRYISQADDLRALRGRLDVKRQFTVLAVSPQRLACEYDDMSIDIPLNQILKTAITFLQRMSRANENQRKLLELSHAFDRVRTLAVGMLPFDEVILDRTNAHWHDLLRLAELLLGHRFQSTNVGDDQGFSLLFDMSRLFESFVGRAFQQSVSAMGIHVALQGPRRFALSELDGETQRFMTKPDIVIHEDEEPFMIIDTKWKRLLGEVDDSKRGVSQADVYQMMAYGQIYGAKHLMLLYPHHHELDSAGILATFRTTGARGTRLSVATLDLVQFDTIRDQLSSLYRHHVGADPNLAA